MRLQPPDTAPEHIGPVRPTNFGLLFDVKAKPDPGALVLRQYREDHRLRLVRDEIRSRYRMIQRARRLAGVKWTRQEPR